MKPKKTSLSNLELCLWFQPEYTGGQVTCQDLVIQWCWLTQICRVFHCRTWYHQRSSNCRPRCPRWRRRRRVVRRGTSPFSSQNSTLPFQSPAPDPDHGNDDVFRKIRDWKKSSRAPATPSITRTMRMSGLALVQTSGTSPTTFTLRKTR